MSIIPKYIRYGNVYIESNTGTVLHNTVLLSLLNNGKIIALPYYELCTLGVEKNPKVNNVKNTDGNIYLNIKCSESIFFKNLKDFVIKYQEKGNLSWATNVVVNFQNLIDDLNNSCNLRLENELIRDVHHIEIKFESKKDLNEKILFLRELLENNSHLQILE